MEIYKRARPVVDLTNIELLQRYPNEVRGIEFAEGQQQLEFLLQKVGENVEKFFRDIPNTTSREQIRRERLRDGRVEESVSQSFNYVAHMDSLAGWLEGRTDTAGREMPPDLMSRQSFMTLGFAGTSLYFHPKHQFGCQFLYVGRLTKAPRYHVIAFAQKPGITDLVGQFSSPLRSDRVHLLFQGFIWVDPMSYQIVRLKQSLLAPRGDVLLNVADSDIEYDDVRFQSIATPFWLPKEVVVTMGFAGLQYRNRHRYSDYRVFTVEVEQKISPPRKKFPN